MNKFLHGIIHLTFANIHKKRRFLCMFAMEKTFEWSEDGKVLLKLLDNGVKEVVVPDGVVTIGDEAFKKCSSLQSISLPDSLTTIGEKAFCKCFS